LILLLTDVAAHVADCVKRRQIGLKQC